MYKKIVFLMENIFSTRDYTRFGIKMLEDSGYEVEVWNYMPFLYPDLYMSAKDDEYDYKSYKVFKNKVNGLKELTKLDKDCFVVCLIGYNFNTYKVFKTMAKCGINYGIFVSSMPSVSYSNKRNLIAWLNVRKVINVLFKLVPFNLLGLKTAKYIFAGGEKSLIINRFPIDINSKVCWFHSLDYDISLESKNLNLENEKYIVFLDEYLPFHSDFKRAGLDSPVTADEYYIILNKFFTFLEKHFKIDVIIAAHPRSDYKNTDYFKGRTIIKGKSADLVKESKFVITHCSNSINFAVLYKKPILFVTMDNIKSSILGPLIEKMSYELGTYPIDISKEDEFEKTLTLIEVDEEKYKKYKNDYIKKKGTEENYFWALVAKQLKNE